MAHIMLDRINQVTTEIQSHDHFVNGVSPRFLGVVPVNVNQSRFGNGATRPAYKVVIAETAGSRQVFHRDEFFVDEGGRLLPEAQIAVGNYFLPVFQIFIRYDED